MSGLDVVQSQRKEIKKVEFILRDVKYVLLYGVVWFIFDEIKLLSNLEFLMLYSDHRLKCCLWGIFSENVTNEVKILKVGDICLIRFAKIVKYNGIAVPFSE